MTLVGLPNKVTTEPATITKDSTDLVFRLKTDPASPAGETKTLFCQVVVTQDGEPIVHNLGFGRLRIDAPLPQKKNAPASAKPAVASATPEAPAKPLSRLEKLRLESQERAKAAAAGLSASRDEDEANTPPPLPLTESGSSEMTSAGRPSAL